MNKIVKLITVGSVVCATSMFAAGTAACKGCHGQQFEKKAMGKSKVVKDMSEADIVKALKGYKDGSYGGAMKGIMKGQVASLSDADIAALAKEIKSGGSSSANAAAPATPKKKLIDINAKVADKSRLAKEDLGNKKEVSEEALGLRKTDLYKEEQKTQGVKTDYSRPAPGESTRFERAYVNAPPMIPHSVDGLLPITKDNNQCLGCHMPDVAKSVGAVAIPPSHFTNFRPKTEYKNGELVKEGKTVGPKGQLGNVGDIKIAKFKKLNHLYQGRFNCSQCHAPQAKVDTVVGNTFKPDGLDEKTKSGSTLLDTINEGVQ